MTVTEGDSTSVIFWLGEEGLEVKQSQNLNRIEMPSAGKPYVKVLWSGERELWLYDYWERMRRSQQLCE